MYKEGFPSKLKKAREKTGFTQREVEKETGILQSTIARYELGTLEPDIEKLGILADFYQVDVNWLIGSGNYNTHEAIYQTKKIAT